MILQKEYTTVRVAAKDLLGGKRLAYGSLKDAVKSLDRALSDMDKAVKDVKSAAEKAWVLMG